MSQFIMFPDEMADVEVTVEINASLHDIVSLLLLINFGQEIGIEEVGDLSSIYSDLMTQVSQYGLISDQGDINND
jgi:hypothetical protein